MHSLVPPYRVIRLPVWQLAVLGGTCPRTNISGGLDKVMLSGCKGLELVRIHLRSMLNPQSQVLQHFEETNRFLPSNYFLVHAFKVLTFRL